MAILINKHNLAVGQFAAKNESRYSMHAIQVSEQGTCATDGACLVKVSAPNQKASEFPLIDGVERQENITPFLLPLDAAQKIAKAMPQNERIPVLNTALVAASPVHGENPKPATIAVTDLDTPQVFKPRCLNGQFPNVDDVIPKDEPAFEIVLPAHYLAKLAKAAGDFSDLRGTGENSDEYLLLQMWDRSKAVVIRTRNTETEQDWFAMLMPVKFGSKSNIVKAVEPEEPVK